jgi:hypothetical protein
VVTPAAALPRTASKNNLTHISTASILKQVLSASHEPVREKEKTPSQFLLTPRHTPGRAEIHFDGTSF